MFPMRLETPRLLLREFLPSDVDAVHAYASNPDVVKYEVWGPNTRGETEQFLSSVVLPAQRAEPRMTYELAIEAKDIGLIGGCGMRIKDAANRTSDLGYVLAREHWGKGYMPEAISALLDFGFTTLGLHRIWATTDARNVQSKRVLEKTGMRQEGQRKADQFRRGEWTDSCLYAVLEGERAARRVPSNPALKVRLAVKSDYAAISVLFACIDDLHSSTRPDLYRAVSAPARSAEYIDELISGDDVLLLVAEGPSGLVGVAIAYLKTAQAALVVATRKFVLMDLLVTHPDHRRTGVGASLMQRVEEWAKEGDAPSVELGVHEFNTGARKFYKKLGYDTRTRRLEKRLAW
jgi:ribosomal-protein-alanine N-acetyltransferase